MKKELDEIDNYEFFELINIILALIVCYAGALNKGQTGFYLALPSLFILFFTYFMAPRFSSKKFIKNSIISVFVLIGIINFFPGVYYNIVGENITVKVDICLLQRSNNGFVDKYFEGRECKYLNGNEILNDKNIIRGSSVKVVDVEGHNNFLSTKLIILKLKKDDIYFSIPIAGDESSLFESEKYGNITMDKLRNKLIDLFSIFLYAFPLSIILFLFLCNMRYDLNTNNENAEVNNKSEQ